MVLADTEFGTIDVFTAVHQRSWRAVLGVRHFRKLEDGCSLKQLYRQGTRGQQVYLQGIPFPVTVSWFWLKQQGATRAPLCRLHLSLLGGLSGHWGANLGR
jgi:hypothetical protein